MEINWCKAVRAYLIDCLFGEPWKKHDLPCVTKFVTNTKGYLKTLWVQIQLGNAFRILYICRVLLFCFQNQNQNK